VAIWCFDGGVSGVWYREGFYVIIHNRGYGLHRILHYKAESLHFKYVLNELGQELGLITQFPTLNISKKLETPLLLTLHRF
jgi:hypothetical protein